MIVFKQNNGYLSVEFKKKLLKRGLLVFSLILFAAATQAQYNYDQWGIGLSAGTVKPYSDLKQNDTNIGYTASLYYNYSPYLPTAFELQTGKLSGGNNDSDPSHRYFTNNYFAFNFHLDVQLGELIDYQNSWLLNRIKGFYVGIGGGLIFNRISSIRRYALDDPAYMFPGQDHTINGWIPLRFGYEFKVYDSYDEPFMTVFFNYAHYLTFAEGLDGYNDPSTRFKNNVQDMARSITLGVKVNFGNANSYIKSIR